jgi:hypothetical protein
MQYEAVCPITIEEQEPEEFLSARQYFQQKMMVKGNLTQRAAAASSTQISQT